MTTVNVQEAKTQLSRLLERAAAGEEIVIARNGRPLAKLVGLLNVKTPRIPVSMRGQIVMADDFDAPLPPEILAEWPSSA